MENKVLSFWQAHNFPQNAAIYCAVSGGADSMALLWLLLRLQARLQITVKAVHFNHHLRGAESDRDEAFVRDFCAQNAIPLLVGSADISEIARRTGESIEECARRERYAYFASLGSFVATAHTQEDSFETVLNNLIRGTALKGLCGIPPKRAYLLRPFLCLSHEDVRNYLSAQGIAHVEDSTNDKRACLRNRLRKDVLPLLRAENPSLLDAFSESAAFLRKDEDYLTSLAEAALADAKCGGGYRAQSLAAQPEPIRRRAIRALLWDVKKLSRRHIEAVEALLFSQNPSAAATLPDGLVARRTYDLLIVEKSAPPQVLPTAPLRIGEETALASFGISLFAEWRPCDACDRLAFRADRETLCVRARQTGDTLRLPGGRKTVKKLMIDRKIPLLQRDLVPILADKDGVLAVLNVGVNLDRKATVGENAVIITVKRG